MMALPCRQRHLCAGSLRLVPTLLQQSPSDDPVHGVEVIGEDGAVGGELVGGDVAAADFVLPGAGGVEAVGEQGFPVLSGGLCQEDVVRGRSRARTARQTPVPLKSGAPNAEHGAPALAGRESEGGRWGEEPRGFPDHSVGAAWEESPRISPLGTSPCQRHDGR